jgi:membrane-bound lytic murein transglycosylase D
MAYHDAAGNLTNEPDRAKRVGMGRARHAESNLLWIAAWLVAWLAVGPALAAPARAPAKAPAKTPAAVTKKAAPVAKAADAKPASRGEPTRAAQAKPAPAKAPAKVSAKASAPPKATEQPAKASPKSKPAATKAGAARRRLPLPRQPGGAPGVADEAARRAIAGSAPTDPAAPASDSAELRAMRELDQELFPPVEAPADAPWSASVAPPAGPAVDPSGLPGRRVLAREPAAEPERDLSWLAVLEKPDLPVRFEPAVVRYLEFYKNDPRGRRMVAGWMQRSGRYRDAIVRMLRDHQLPEDLLWVVLVESAFEPSAHSHAGAAGLWQFMPATGRIYGLTVNRRIDERLDPERSTLAAIKHLKDLYQRFGGWELGLAAYNMGYGGLLASVRKYNTNDYWELRRLEAGLPYETALYVPKILAMAVVARNCRVFGCDGLKLAEPQPFGEVGQDAVAVPAGVMLSEVALAAGVSPEVLAALNPHLLGSRMPPLEEAASPRPAWIVRVPQGKGARAAGLLPGLGGGRRLGTHRVRWGESLERVAARVHTSEAHLAALNELAPYESPRPGATLFVPSNGAPPSGTEEPAERPVVVVPDEDFEAPGRRPVFYEIVFGDALDDVARVTGLGPGEIARWNHLDPAATLQSGMWLRLFVPNDAVMPADVVLLEASEVRALRAGSPEFHAHFVGKSGRTRLEVTVGERDSWASIGRRYGLSVSMLERINGRSRRSRLEPGETVVVYATEALARRAAASAAGGQPADAVEAAALGSAGPAPTEAAEPAPEEAPAEGAAPAAGDDETEPVDNAKSPAGG